MKIAMQECSNIHNKLSSALVPVLPGASRTVLSPTICRRFLFIPRRSTRPPFGFLSSLVEEELRSDDALRLPLGNAFGPPRKRSTYTPSFSTQPGPRSRPYYQRCRARLQQRTTDYCRIFYDHLHQWVRLVRCNAVHGELTSPVAASSRRLVRSS